MNAVTEVAAVFGSTGDHAIGGPQPPKLLN